MRFSSFVIPHSISLGLTVCFVMWCDIQMALQRMNVMANYRHFYESHSPPPFQMIEDAASVSALALMPYLTEVSEYEGRAYYGGKILKVVDVPHVKVQTHEADPKEVEGGTLRFMAWEAGGIYVVAARGTYGSGNWQINFQIQPAKVDFEPYHSIVTPGDKAVR